MKRAIRALQSEAYQKAFRKTTSRLPPVNDKAEAVGAIKLLAIHQLAFQVNKLDTEVAIHLNKKPRAGVPCLEIQHDQVFGDDNYVCWFYDPVSTATYIYAICSLVGIFGLILFPLWPLYMRVAVWYLSMACLGLVGLFFAIAVLRLFIFMPTYFLASPGIWLFPNLFADVGIVASFIPLWAWHGVDTLKLHKPKKRRSKKQKQEKAAKLKLDSDIKQVQQEAVKTLQDRLESINARIEALAKEREATGTPMSPAEMSKLGSDLFAQAMNSFGKLGEDDTDSQDDQEALAASHKQSLGESPEEGTTILEETQI